MTIPPKIMNKFAVAAGSGSKEIYQNVFKFAIIIILESSGPYIRASNFPV
jgi:hypothetical protein